MSAAIVSRLLSHLIVVDGQVYDIELQLLKKYLAEQSLTEIDVDEVYEIIRNSDCASRWEELALAIAGTDNISYQKKFIEQGLTIALCDNYLDPLEQGLLQRCLELWNYDVEEYQKLYENATLNASRSNKDNGRTSLDVLARLSAPWAKKIIDTVANYISSEEFGVKLKVISNKLLLSGSEYEKGVKISSSVAKADLDYVLPILLGNTTKLGKAAKELQNLLAELSEFKEVNNEEFNVKKTLEELQKSISEIIEQRIFENEQAAIKKRRAMNFFTISFLGKTKSGKSTLHAIITGEGHDSIGKGKQRTTRYNRVYTWKNIRIIDTPGIGAPGGKTDEEIASDVIDESDVICYLVKNDSIQEAEFSFLKHIKEKNKPLIILLNVKENLLSEKRLERYLQDPEKAFNRTDAQSLDGHINRIKRYASENYKNNLITIIPVQLLAALMSRDPENKRITKKLYRASHIQQFLDSLRLSIIDEGPIRRSQTIIDGSIYTLIQTENTFNEYIDNLSNMHEKLKRYRQDLDKEMQKKRRKYKKEIEEVLHDCFVKLKENIYEFASDHYKSKEGVIERAWQKYLEEIKFETLINSSIEVAIDKYASELQQYFKEIHEDLTLSNNRFINTVDPKTSGIFSWNSFFENLGKIFMGVGGVLLLILSSNPIGWVVIGVGFVFQLIKGLFTSKQEKIRRATQKLYDYLTDNVEEQELSSKNSVIANFDKIHQKIVTQIEFYFLANIKALESAIYCLRESKQFTSADIFRLNKAYAFRVLNYLFAPSIDKLQTEISDLAIAESVLNVDRLYGNLFEIFVPVGVYRHNYDSKMKTITNKLQERISVQPEYKRGECEVAVSKQK